MQKPTSTSSATCSSTNSVPHSMSAMSDSVCVEYVSLTRGAASQHHHLGVIADPVRIRKCPSSLRVVLHGTAGTNNSRWYWWHQCADSTSNDSTSNVNALNHAPMHGGTVLPCGF